MNAKKIRIGFVGSGNVATHLAKGFDALDCVEVCQVFSRDMVHAKALLCKLKACSPFTDLSLLDASLDALIIAVSDASIREVVASMPQFGGLLLHTSGSVPMDVLNDKSSQYGVLYPLQTFSRDVELSLADVPFFTEANNDETRQRVDELAHALSQHVYHANSDQRRILHLAGVLSCNFVTYLWECATQVLGTEGYDFSVVVPLIEATMRKVEDCGAHAAQTGPARRGDVAVMQRHMEMLSPEQKEIYKLLSQAIMASHNVKGNI